VIPLAISYGRLVFGEIGKKIGPILSRPTGLAGLTGKPTVIFPFFAEK